MTVKRRTNRTANPASAYLEQQAQNPVLWHPWGKDAIEVAQRESKPILLSVGYSACHWCQMMDRESYHDEEIADLLNARFVCVKVDREERPDIDQVYQTALEILRPGGGGWPLTIWLTPNLEPYYAGTYFPPTDRNDLPGFLRVLRTMADHYEENRDGVEKKAGETAVKIREALTFGSDEEIVGYDVIDEYMEKVVKGHDKAHGGFGGAPKFPPAQHLSLALRSYRRTGDEDLLHVVVHTLDRMAAGGIHDRLGGGFHRYATDVRWIVPRFEKMLYDNALLTHTYLDAYLVTGEERFRDVAKGCLDFVIRDMVNDAGGFCSTLHADVAGEEGAHYLWTEEEILAALGERDGAVFNEYYGVSKAGNFKGNRCVLTVARPIQEAVLRADMSCAELEELLATGRAKLFAVRSRRDPPARDDKIIASWNGLMIGALARGGRVCDIPEYIEAATKAASFIRDNMVREGSLLRVYREGEARFDGFLDDYGFFANGLVDLYEATFELEWLSWASLLAESVYERFSDADSGGLFYTTYDHERLVARTRERQDAAMPSGASQALMASLRIARLTGDEKLKGLGLAVIRSYGSKIRERPTAFATMLAALDFHLAPATEIAVVGHLENPDAEILRRLVNGCYLPNAVIAGSHVNGATPSTSAPAEGFPPVSIPLLAGKKAIRGRPTVYVCRDRTCSRPITTPDKLLAALSG